MNGFHAQQPCVLHVVWGRVRGDKTCTNRQPLRFHAKRTASTLSLEPDEAVHKRTPEDAAPLAFTTGRQKPRRQRPNPVPVTGSHSGALVGGWHCQWRECSNQGTEGPRRSVVLDRERGVKSPFGAVKSPFDFVPLGGRVFFYPLSFDPFGRVPRAPSSGEHGPGP